MSNWIEEDGKAFTDALNEKQRVRNLIAYSDYWSNLLEKIRTDVAALN
ncbi:MAG TPA: hypothetical protein VK612_03680 [Pyrinomonadaceae bacterium]|nr:hypothetical protein [Pyrinomonadaceae bacterium]